MNEIIKKVLYIIAALYFIISIIGGGIQTYRLERSMERCEQYRIELESAKNREYEIGESISRTSDILRQTSNTVEGLRKKLEAVEDSYNYMWQLLYDDDNIISNGENK